MVGVFIQWKSANITNQSAPQKPVMKHLPENPYLSFCTIMLHVAVYDPPLEFVSEGHEPFIITFALSRSHLPEIRRKSPCAVSSYNKSLPT